MLSFGPVLRFVDRYRVKMRTNPMSFSESVSYTILMGESDTIQFIGTYNSIALTHQITYW